MVPSKAPSMVPSKAPSMMPSKAPSMVPSRMNNPNEDARSNIVKNSQFQEPDFNDRSLVGNSNYSNNSRPSIPSMESNNQGPNKGIHAHNLRDLNPVNPGIEVHSLSNNNHLIQAYGLKH